MAAWRGSNDKLSMSKPVPPKRGVPFRLGNAHGAKAAKKMKKEKTVENPPAQWKAGKREWLIIATLVIISLMAALDATILVPVLPVSHLQSAG